MKPLFSPVYSITSSLFSSKQLIATCAIAILTSLASPAVTQAATPIPAELRTNGFTGWKYSGATATGKSGRWETVEGTVKGTENPEAHIRPQPPMASCSRMPLSNAM